MSNKQNKHKPDAGYIVAVQFNVLGIRAVAAELDIFPENLAKALDKAGFQIVADPFNLSADAGKVITIQEQEKTSDLEVSDASSNAATD